MTFRNFNTLTILCTVFCTYFIFTPIAYAQNNLNFFETPSFNERQPHLTGEQLLEINKIKQRYPNAEIRFITPEEAKIIQQNNNIILAENSQVVINPQSSSTYNLEKSNTNKCDRNTQKEVSHSQSTPITDNLLSNSIDFLDSTNAGSDDLALIIFVVIGLVITIFLVIYTMKFFYDAISREDLCFWWSLNTHANAIISSNDKGHLNGIKLSSGFIEDKVNVGISADLGHINAELELDNNTKHKVRGNYLMFGPSIRFYSYAHEDSNYLAFDLLVGSVDYKEKNILSYARAAYNFSINQHLRMGFSIGSLYLDLDDKKDLIRKDNSFNLTAGVDVGYKF